ncbi:hypothetical protein QOT17_003915 [Balamuthia mandrillaris]
MGFASPEVTALMATILTGSIFSCLGTCFIIITCFVLGKNKFLYWRLVMGLSVCLFIYSITVLISSAMVLARSPIYEAICNIQAYSIQASEQGAAVYILMIAVNVYLSVVTRYTPTLSAEILFHAIPLLWGSIQALFPIFELIPSIRYGRGEGWCWIEVKPSYARVVMSFTWIWIAIMAVFILYIIVYLRIRRERDLTSFRKALLKGTDPTQKVTRALFLYPLAFSMLYVPRTVSAIVEGASGFYFEVELFEAIFFALQGFMATVVFLFTGDVIKVRTTKNRRDAGVAETEEEDEEEYKKKNKNKNKKIKKEETV